MKCVKPSSDWNSILGLLDVLCKLDVVDDYNFYVLPSGRIYFICGYTKIVGDGDEIIRRMKGE